jgi:hypothetical protein
MVTTMCRICEGDYDENTRELDCSGCPRLQTLPENLGKLKELNCNYCPNLRQLSDNLGKLEILYCYNCLLLQNLPECLGNLKYLDCARCPRLQKLPDNLGKLEILWCYSCPLLQSLPVDTTLECLGNLKELNCRNCPLLQKLPENLRYLSCRGCHWLNHSQNPDYNSNIQKLIILQNFVRKYLKYRRFVKYVNSKAFIEWIYDPERIGGRLSKKSLEKTFTNFCNYKMDELDYPITKIKDYLYLGCMDRAKDFGNISDITHVINVTDDIPNYHNHIKYLNIPVNDHPNVDISVYFENVCEYISKERRLDPNLKILVHCHAGISRSPTIVIAYLIYAENMTFTDAYNYIAKRRAFIRPNNGFVKQLKIFETKFRQN